MNPARGRLARLPSGHVAEVVDHDRGRLRAVVLRTGRSVTVHADRVAWVGGDGP